MKIEEYNINRFKEAFLYYLDMKYPLATSKSNRTRVSDALFLFRIDTDRDVSSLVISLADSVEVRDETVRWLEEKYLKHRKKPHRDAVAYVRASTELSTFFKLIYKIEQSKIRKPRVLKCNKTKN